MRRRTKAWGRLALTDSPPRLVLVLVPFQQHRQRLFPVLVLVLVLRLPRCLLPRKSHRLVDVLG